MRHARLQSPAAFVAVQHDLLWMHTSLNSEDQTSVRTQTPATQSASVVNLSQVISQKEADAQKQKQLTSILVQTPSPAKEVVFR